MNNAPEGTYGPHGSRLANAADPRVDSDNDNRGAGPMTGGTANPSSSSSTHGTGMAAGTAQAGTTGGGMTTTTTGQTTENTGERIARNIKGTVAQGHGLTESLRGNINSAIDSLVGDKTKQPYDEAVAREGEREVLTKEFGKQGTVHKNF
ncbi:hypothetical protein QBC47DRAFT_389191 [Echria macrotheca]|uniref:Uncharacterized protein n=1 Tax=Echria macrotheca TaxID=438768 RepID=A0AAJ0F6V5_9PEZI|nr:hypothetical protein QBC47DRAFT_389191 [Echria macrotheca]